MNMQPRGQQNAVFDRYGAMWECRYEEFIPAYEYVEEGGDYKNWMLVNVLKLLIIIIMVFNQIQHV